MILVMTASVSPANVKQLCIKDPEIRLGQYCAAIHFYIKCKQIDKIVFCDNSDSLYGFESEQKLARKNNVRLEILKFKLDYKMVEKYGKGYGEGEILKYVMTNSQLLENEDYFYKVTGRLIVKNISLLIRKNHKKEALFNRNLYAYKSLDTRFWGIKKSDYIQFLMESYNKVHDNKGIYLEMCFKRDLDKANIQYKSFCVYPVINGYSGTLGKKYKETNWYTKIIYDLMCYFNCYNSEKGFFVVFLIYNIVFCGQKTMDVCYTYMVNNVD